MKNLMKYGFFALLSAMLFLTSCEDDPIDPIETGPSAKISSATLAFENQTFEPGLTIGNIDVEFTKGTHDLNVVQIERNGEKMVSGWDLADASGNPMNVDPTQVIKLTEDQKTGATLRFIIDLSDEETTDNYTWLVSDIESNIDSTETLSLTTKFEGTPIQEFSGYLLSNSGGPVGTGGLDLDTGNETGSQDDAAEIADAGIDTNRPVTDNWIQKFLGVNGSKVMPLDSSFDYDGVTTKEQIATAYSEGSVISGTTDVVQEGQMFIIKNGTKHYLLKVKDIVITNEPSENSDYMEFFIKK